MIGTGFLEGFPLKSSSRVSIGSVMVRIGVGQGCPLEGHKGSP